MYQAYVLTPCLPAALDPSPFQATHAAILDDYAVLASEDVTCIHALLLPTDPNLMTLRIVCEQAVLESIEADPNYLILSAEPIEEPL